MTQKLLVPKYDKLHASTEENDKEKKSPEMFNQLSTKISLILSLTSEQHCFQSQKHQYLAEFANKIKKIPTINVAITLCYMK